LDDTDKLDDFIRFHRLVEGHTLPLSSGASGYAILL